jgi:transcriptional regulator with XRE-family HTH domain
MADAELLGQMLREARQRMNLSLAQAEKQTRIRAKYLEALEQGSYLVLPSIVHTRGFLRTYARFVGLDGDLVVSRFDEIVHGARKRGRRAADPVALPGDEPLPPIKRAKRLTQTQETSAVKPARRAGTETTTAAPVIGKTAQDEQRKVRFSARSAALIGFLALLLIASVFVLTNFGDSLVRLLTGAENPPGGALVPFNAPSNTPAASLTPTATPTLALPSPLPTVGGVNSAPATTPTSASTAGSAEGGLTVEFRIEARTWIQISADGSPSYVGAPGPGTVLRYSGQRIFVRASNAVGVRVVVNGVEQGILGARGEIAERTYTPTGILLPTETAPPTPVP